MSSAPAKAATTRKVPRKGWEGCDNIKNPASDGGIFNLHRYLQSVSFHHIVLMTEIDDGSDESREADESHNQKERC